MIFSFSVSHFFIIQSLRPTDRQTGRQLHEEVFKYRLFQLDGVKAELMNVSNLTEFRNALDTIAELGRAHSILPFIHFEVHGSPHGLELGNGELVSWKDLYPYLIAINTCTKNNLFLTLATCYGASISETCDIRVRAPLAWYIGPTNTISSEEAYGDYTVFFDRLLDSLDIYTALTAMNAQNPNRPYTFYSAEEFYKDALKQWIEEHKVPEKQEQQKQYILELARKKGITLSDEVIFKVVEEEIVKIPQFAKMALEYFLFKSDVSPDINFISVSPS